MRRAVLLALPLAACGGDPATLPPLGQVQLHVDTDAPLPPAPGEALREDEPRPLFDMLRVDLLPPDSSAPCAGCTRRFDVDRGRFARLEVSVGVLLPPRVAGYRARLRLFRGAAMTLGEPPPGATIDVTVLLPPVEEEGIEHRQVLLATDDVGRPVGAASPVYPALGAPLSSRVGTWPGAQPVPCAGEPMPGEVCVPGGAYWMGNPLVVGVSPQQDADRQRLVVISPYYLDATEVVVASFRAAGMLPALSWNGDTTGSSGESYCTFTHDEGARDDLPVNCLDWSTARAYCQARGGDLPTEAQRQYVASGLVGHLYPWGQDAPDCDDAVIARAGHFEFDYMPTNRCSPSGSPDEVGGALPVASATRDRVELPGGTVVDLAGNMGEWLLDVFNTQDGPCWSEARVYHDPLCDTHEFGVATRSLMPGSWFWEGDQARAAVRHAGDPAGFNHAIGFRCARAPLE